MGSINMQSPKKWKKFEDIVAKVRKDFSPNATIKTREKILGKKSGCPRELDITIRETIGPDEMLIAIDCKDLSRKVDIKKVEECIGLFDDVGVNQGVIVSAKGFTKSALERGKRNNINLYTLVDSDDHDWKSDVRLKFLIFIYTLNAWQYEFSSLDPNLTSLPLEGYEDIDIFTKDEVLLGKLGDIFKEKWVDLIKFDDEEVTGDFIGQSVTIKCAEKFCSIEVIANLDIKEEVYLCSLPISKVSGFKDETNGNVIIAKGFTLQEFGLEEIRRIGEIVKDEEEAKRLTKFGTMKFFLCPNWR